MVVDVKHRDWLECYLPWTQWSDSIFHEECLIPWLGGQEVYISAALGERAAPYREVGVVWLPLGVSEGFVPECQFLEDLLGSEIEHASLAIICA